MGQTHALLGLDLTTLAVVLGLATLSVRSASTPDARIYAVAHDDRTYAVAHDNRTYSIGE
jgi:hypothetical protein